MNQRILVVDDEPDVRDLIATHLQLNGFEPLFAEEGVAAIAEARVKQPALILLDLMLPNVSGIHVCKTLKQDDATASIPIIMLTAKADELDRILGLEMGAVDYVTKPFSPRELMLRVKVALGRTVSDKETKARLMYGDLVVDRQKHEELVKGERINCTATEFKLLLVLMERKGRLQDRDRLLNDVWGYETAIDTRTVDTHMRRLREKLKHCGDYLETVRGFGYRFIGHE